ncbi:MAG: protein kinase domain-containing protein [Desulfobaccales bacterium]
MTAINPNPLKPGDVVARRYVILRHLRDEPCGGVWLTQDRTLGMDVALKFLPRGTPHFEKIREDLRREAALALKLRHPNILQVIHFNEGDEGVYLIEEPFQGESLLGHLNRLERFRLPTALDLLEQVAQALAVVHRHHEVHQSLNPCHILVEDQTIKLINLACSAPEEDEPRVTRLELKAYLAPETIRGEAVTPAANVFSLGVLGFRLTAGSLPYALTFDEPMPYRLEDMPVDLGEIPLPLQNLLLQCLALDPRDRFEDADAFLAALEQRRESWRTPASVRWAGWVREGKEEGGGLKGAIARAWGLFRQGGEGAAGKLKEGLQNLKDTQPPAMARRLLLGLGGVVLILILLVWGGRALFQKAAVSPPPAPTVPEKATPPGPPAPAGKLPAAGGPPMSAAIESAPARSTPGTAAPPAVSAAKTAKPAGAPSKEAYQVTVAAYSSLEDAKAMRKRLQGKNLSAQVFRSTSGNKTVFLVKVGPFAERKRAEEVAQRIKALEHLNRTPKVVLIPSENSKTPSTKARR